MALKYNYIIEKSLETQVPVRKASSSHPQHTHTHTFLTAFSVQTMSDFILQKDKMVLHSLKYFFLI